MRYGAAQPCGAQVSTRRRVARTCAREMVSHSMSTMLQLLTSMSLRECCAASRRALAHSVCTALPTASGSRRLRRRYFKIWRGSRSTEPVDAKTPFRRKGTVTMPSRLLPTVSTSARAPLPFACGHGRSRTAHGRTAGTMLRQQHRQGCCDGGARCSMGHRLVKQEKALALSTCKQV